MELRLMEAKHEANRTKEETERQAELEREVSAWLSVYKFSSLFIMQKDVWLSFECPRFVSFYNTHLSFYR